MAADEIAELASKLGISAGQLSKLRVKHKSDEKLIAWLRSAVRQHRDRKWLLSTNPSSYVTDSEHPTPDGDERHYGYTETSYQTIDDPGEGPPPNEIGSYRKSREARDAYQAERLEEVGDLLSALRELRAAIDAMPKDRRQRMSRSLWKLKAKINEAEGELRRQVAA